MIKHFTASYFAVYFFVLSEDFFYNIHHVCSQRSGAGPYIDSAVFLADTPFFDILGIPLNGYIQTAFNTFCFSSHAVNAAFHHNAKIVCRKAELSSVGCSYISSQPIRPYLSAEGSFKE